MTGPIRAFNLHSTMIQRLPFQNILDFTAKQSQTNSPQFVANIASWLDKYR